MRFWCWEDFNPCTIPTPPTPPGSSAVGIPVGEGARQRPFYFCGFGRESRAGKSPLWDESSHLQPQSSLRKGEVGTPAGERRTRLPQRPPRLRSGLGQRRAGRRASCPAVRMRRAPPPPNPPLPRSCPAQKPTFRCSPEAGGSVICFPPLGLWPRLGAWAGLCCLLLDCLALAGRMFRKQGSLKAKRFLKV
jgi:hypothetical protein